MKKSKHSLSLIIPALAPFGTRINKTKMKMENKNMTSETWNPNPFMWFDRILLILTAMEKMKIDRYITPKERVIIDSLLKLNNTKGLTFSIHCINSERAYFPWVDSIFTFRKKLIIKITLGNNAKKKTNNFLRTWIVNTLRLLWFFRPFPVSRAAINIAKKLNTRMWDKNVMVSRTEKIKICLTSNLPWFLNQ